MKLRQIKLAGFKTFVDQTTIKLDGQLAGIVGPNGCGKSNIMESVKWVLGSSSAKEMRGESMESVIFNGTDTRQPIGRASVELFFDNSDGKTPAEWASYAEISVKRVIEKDKGSTYLINNTTVRRKDVADLFLGTGLGAKGYAIIGQNTISQIVEAKPEELKNYLEEAAGVSKYKERRKETEYRLRDTKDNLERVNDLLREINGQITKLESQAQTAKKHNDLNEKLKLIQAQIYLVKKRLASKTWEASKNTVNTVSIKLDKHKAELTHVESEAEAARQEHIQASDAINVNQAKFYETNSAVTDVENRLNNLNEKIARLSQLKENSQIKFQEYETLHNQLASQLDESDKELVDNNQRLSQLADDLEVSRTEFVAAETSYKQADAQWSQSNTRLQELGERSNVENATIELSEEIIKDLHTRIQLLDDELKELKEGEVEVKKPEELIDAEKMEQDVIDRINNEKNKLENLNKEADQIKEDTLINKQAISEAEIHISSLKQMDEAEANPEKIADWLGTIGSHNKDNIFKEIEIKDGWEMALGNILGARMHAYQALDFKDGNNKRPPHSVALITAKNVSSFTLNEKLTSALTVVNIKNLDIKPAMIEWLAHTYISSSNDALANQKHLKAGEIVVTKEGDIFGTNFQIISSESEDQSNHLLRMKKIDQYQKQLPTLLDAQKKLHDTFNANDNEQKACKEQLILLETQQKKIVNEMDDYRQSFNKQLNLVEVNNNRMVTVENDKQNLESQAETNTKKLDAKKIIIEQLATEISTIASENLVHKDAKTQSQIIFDEKKLAFDNQQKLEQEIGYNIKVLDNKISTIHERQSTLINEKNALLQELNAANNDEHKDDIGSLESELRQKLEEKEVAEKSLTSAREDISVKENKLRELESKRLEAQHALNPINEELQQARLNEREANVVFEQCCESINTSSIQEETIEQSLKEDADLDQLEESYINTNNRIERLGPVNLAAISELETIRERQAYIQKQVEDLEEASKTLLDAIHKIDRETREKLKATYQEVNQNFNDFFKTLFNGGRAQLELLGQEILDTGLQVVAQPPGKKNQTIHLLSGGEKALTAIALVFALFKLNPSPFCLMDEVDAPLDDSNAQRFCDVVKSMAKNTQFLFVSHNKLTMEIAEQLIGVTMQEAGVSRIVEVDLQDLHTMELVE